MTIKTPRFLREYANYQINRIKVVCPLISEKDAEEIRHYIDSNVRGCQRGYVSIEDAMMCIHDRLTELDEYGNIIPPKKYSEM